MAEQVNDLIKELFEQFSLRIKIRRGKSALVLVTSPKQISIENADGAMAIRGEEWRLSLVGIDKVRFLRVETTGKMGRGVDFLNAAGKSVVRLAVRRLDERAVDTFDRLCHKYAMISTGATT